VLKVGGGKVGVLDPYALNVVLKEERFDLSLLWAQQFQLVTQQG
jgi:hypothetical protein